MRPSLSRNRLAVLTTAACLVATATGLLFLLTKHPPAPDASGRSEATPSPVTPAVPATEETEEPAPEVLAEKAAAVALPSVSVRGEVITAHLATVPESVWQEPLPAQPPYAVPAPDYNAFASQPPPPGVPIIDSPLRPADDAPPDHSEK